MNKMHRALQILNPSPELSGEYTCTVSTYEQEASQSKKMVIYGECHANSLRGWVTLSPCVETLPAARVRNHFSPPPAPPPVPGARPDISGSPWVGPEGLKDINKEKQRLIRNGSENAGNVRYN
ncbi:UNVERIFIED_CONTAM: hypothetical protein PYX00_006425 [Menopon gallinae]|uniref:Uncharacterized protein n=1 Tax=Menopon gallinae TaxID=328185 RepID=A0AAW2HW63_9NEOP